jgi:hypothetical protein
MVVICCRDFYPGESRVALTAATAELRSAWTAEGGCP